MKKTILMIVVAVIIAGVSGAGVYLWQNNKANLEKQVLQNQITELQKKNQTTNNTSSNSLQTNLKAYVSPKYGFSFQYPKELIITSNSSDEHIVLAGSNTDHWAVEVDAQFGPVTVNEDDALYYVLQKFLGASVEEIPIKFNISEISIDGGAARKFVRKQSSDYGNEGVAIKGNNTTLSIMGDTSSNQLFETVISTFKYTK